MLRRVGRYELDGSVKLLADNYQGNHLNSPNDVVPHPDELPDAVLSLGPQRKFDPVISENAPFSLHDPNGILFSPDYKTLYVISTGKGPGDTVGGDGNVYAFDVSSDGKSVSNKRLYTDCVVDGIKCGPGGCAVMSMATCGFLAMPAATSATAG